MMFALISAVRIASFLLLALLLAGCNRGPAVGTVKGTVTLNGQPVDGGLIRLVPADGNSQPADCVIKGGNYSITMPVGEKKVEIYWTKGGSAKVDTASQGTEQVTQMVPAKYNTETTLTYTLDKGTHTQDFALLAK
jgi:predicted small secreted protein